MTDEERKAKNRERNRAYRAANREKVQERDRARRAANREKERERQRAYRAANREKVQERNRAWHAANPEKGREYMRAWCAANPEKKREHNRAWHAANPEKRLAKKHRRRARLRDGCSVGVSPHDWQDICSDPYVQRDGVVWCAYCQKRPGTTRDHVVAIARGGRDERCNVVPCCKPCNFSKGDRSFAEWHRAAEVLGEDLAAWLEHEARYLSTLRRAA
jgi:hypothetical protein